MSLLQHVHAHPSCASIEEGSGEDRTKRLFTMRMIWGKSDSAAFLFLHLLGGRSSILSVSDIVRLKNEVKLEVRLRLTVHLISVFIWAIWEQNSRNRKFIWTMYSNDFEFTHILLETRISIIFGNARAALFIFLKYLISF